jgi:hypothetical protein
MLANGMSMADIVENFLAIGAEQVRICLLYVAYQEKRGAALCGVRDHAVKCIIVINKVANEVSNYVLVYCCVYKSTEVWLRKH